MPKSRYHTDYQAMADSFLDLWQEQIARAMGDGDFLHALTEQMQQFGGAATNERPQNKARRDSYPADASGAGDDELADLRARMAASERRVQRLEAKIRKLETEDEEPAPAAKPKAKPKPARAGSPRRAAKAGTTRAKSAKPAAKPKAKQKAKPTTVKPRKRAVKRR